MELVADWPKVKRIFREAFGSSFHYAVATVTEDGAPHVSPIGSLILGEPGHGIYFERFPQNLPKNLKTNQKICVMAVNSSKWYWLKALLHGKFADPPALRLHGTAGELREATDTEIALWQKRVKSVSFTKGHALMWRDMSKVRDIEFTKIEPVKIGKLTHSASSQ